MNSLWYAFVRWFVRVFFFRTQGGFRSVASRNVPKSGPTIVAPVHLSYADPPAVACGTSRQLTFMAKEELFKGKLGPLISSLGAFPVRRGESDTEAIRKAIAILEEGRALLVFPEGTRGDGKRLQAINRGVTMLAKRTDAVVIPVAIVGTHVLMPRGGGRGRHRVTVAYGEGFRYSDIATGSERENRDHFARELQARLLRLCAENGLNLEAASSD
jgi:1-acyl-sn-glycerol-3-phosphate acyltransferase